MLPSFALAFVPSPVGPQVVLLFLQVFLSGSCYSLRLKGVYLEGETRTAVASLGSRSDRRRVEMRRLAMWAEVSGLGGFGSNRCKAQVASSA